MRTLLILLLIPIFAFAEPKWVEVPRIRNINNFGKVLSDIESRLPEGHNFGGLKDMVTNAHEGTHGVNSRIRMDYFERNRRINGFYCLDGKGCVIEEPNVKISEIEIPLSIRGLMYKPYLENQIGWNEVPLYIFDEWIAFLNGAEARKDLNIKARADTVQSMWEFAIYSLCLAKVVKEKDINYNDAQFREFIMWNIERCLRLSVNEDVFSNYLDKFRTSEDVFNLRSFAKGYLGRKWCAEKLAI